MAILSQAILVTGASTGIGRALVGDLVKHGFHVFAGVRRREDGDRLQKDWGGAVQPLLLDVTRDGDVENAVSVVSQSHFPLVGVVNNAGIVWSGPLEAVDLSDFKKVYEVNVFGALRVTKAFLPLLRKAPPGRGRIVQISSTAGYFAVPFLGPYTSTKFALEAWSDSLRVELKASRIGVSLVEPGNIKTPIWDKSLVQAQSMRSECPEAMKESYGSALDVFYKLAEVSSRTASSTDVVCKAVRHALTASCPRPRYRVGRGATAEWFLARWVPTWIRDQILYRLFWGW